MGREGEEWYGGKERMGGGWGEEWYEGKEGMEGGKKGGRGRRDGENE